MYTEQFKVVTVSDNTNSFGLYQYVAISNQGKAFKACRSGFNCPKQGEILDVPFLGSGNHDLVTMGELSEFIKDAPQAVISEVWKSRD